MLWLTLLLISNGFGASETYVHPLFSFDFVHDVKSADRKSAQQFCALLVSAPGNSFSDQPENQGYSRLINLLNQQHQEAGNFGIGKGIGFFRNQSLAPKIAFPAVAIDYDGRFSEGRTVVPFGWVLKTTAPIYKDLIPQLSSLFSIQILQVTRLFYQEFRTFLEILAGVPGAFEGHLAYLPSDQRVRGQAGVEAVVSDLMTLKKITRGWVIHLHRSLSGAEPSEDQIKNLSSIIVNAVVSQELPANKIALVEILPIIFGISDEIKLSSFGLLDPGKNLVHVFQGPVLIPTPQSGVKRGGKPPVKIHKDWPIWDWRNLAALERNETIRGIPVTWFSPLVPQGKEGMGLINFKIFYQKRPEMRVLEYFRDQSKTTLSRARNDAGVLSAQIIKWTAVDFMADVFEKTLREKTLRNPDKTGPTLVVMAPTSRTSDQALFDNRQEILASALQLRLNALEPNRFEVGVSELKQTLNASTHLMAAGEYDEIYPADGFRFAPGIENAIRAAAHGTRVVIVDDSIRKGILIQALSKSIKLINPGVVVEGLVIGKVLSLSEAERQFPLPPR